jgi:hypothetical protein
VTVEVPVPVYRPLPTALTAPLPLPPPPPRLCRRADTTAAVCELDALLQIPVLEAVIKLANRDRARAALLGANDGQQ